MQLVYVTLLGQREREWEVIPPRQQLLGKNWKKVQ